MMQENSRRNFVKTAAAFSIVSAQSVRGSQANSAVTLGLIGCGNRGMYVSGLFAKNENLKVTAYNDIYEDRFQAAGAKYSGAKRFNSMDDLLADKSIDAVLIAIHWHVLGRIDIPCNGLGASFPTGIMSSMTPCFSGQAAL